MLPLCTASLFFNARKGKVSANGKIQGVGGWGGGKASQTKNSETVDIFGRKVDLQVQIMKSDQ